MNIFKKILWAVLIILPLWIGYIFMKKDYKSQLKMEAFAVKEAFENEKDRLIFILRNTHNMISLYLENLMFQDLYRYMNKKAKKYKLDIFLVVDKDRKVIYRQNNPGFFGDILLKDIYIEEALRRRPVVDFITLPTERLQKEKIENPEVLYSAFPLETYGGAIMGVIVCAKIFPSDEFLQKTKQIESKIKIMPIPMESAYKIKNGKIVLIEKLKDDKTLILEREIFIDIVKNVSCFLSLSCFYIWLFLFILRKKTKIVKKVEVKREILEEKAKQKPILIEFKDSYYLFFSSSLDEENLEIFLKEELLERIDKERKKMVVFDLTECKLVTERFVKSLKVATRGIKLLGSEVVICGISPQLARLMVDIGEGFDGFVMIKQKPACIF